MEGTGYTHCNLDRNGPNGYFFCNLHSLLDGACMFGLVLICIFFARRPGDGQKAGTWVLVQGMRQRHSDDMIKAKYVSTD